MRIRECQIAMLNEDAKPEFMLQNARWMASNDESKRETQYALRKEITILSRRNTVDAASRRLKGWWSFLPSARAARDVIVMAEGALLEPLLYVLRPKDVVNALYSYVGPAFMDWDDDGSNDLAKVARYIAKRQLLRTWELM